MSGEVAPAEAAEEEFVFRIEDADGGEITGRIRVSDGSAIVQVQADGPLGPALADSRAELQQQLREAGLDLGDMQVEWGADGEQHGRRYRWAGGVASEDGARTNVVDAPSSTEVEQPTEQAGPDDLGRGGLLRGRA